MQQTFVKHVAIPYSADFVSSARDSALDRLPNVAIILTEKKYSATFSSEAVTPERDGNTKNLLILSLIQDVKK